MRASQEAERRDRKGRGGKREGKRESRLSLKITRGGIRRGGEE